jgi:diguanylate cyclase (GGDEF)-like protein/PAS domain S-box-containing protein
MNRLHPPVSLSETIGFALVSLACFGCSRLALSLDLARTGLFDFWPASGIAVAAVILGGRRLLAAIALAAVVTGLSIGHTVVATSFEAAGAVVTPWLSLELLGRVRFRSRMRRMSDVTAFVGLAGLLAAAAGAAVGSLGLVLSGTLPPSGLGVAWRDWWLGSMSGVLIVGPAVLILIDLTSVWLRARTILAGLATFVLVGCAAYAMLDSNGSLPYLVLPLLFLLAISDGERGVAIGGLAVAAAAMALNVQGDGPFPGGSHAVELIRTEAFLCVGIVTALLVAAARSERRFAEEAVERMGESERALAEAQQLAHIGSFDADLTTGRTIWSQELYAIFGREVGAVSPGWTAWLACAHPDDRERLAAALRTVERERCAVELVHRIIRPDGQVRTIEAHLRSEGTLRPERVLGTCQDVTAVKLAERRFRSLFEDAALPIVVLDADGAVALSNVRAQLMFGLDETALGARRFEELVPTPDGADPDWWHHAAGDGSAPELDLWGVRADGSRFPAEVSLTVLETEEGTQVSAAIRDVTVLRRAAETLAHQARHDPLTGLPNRLMFLERLDRALARARRSGRLLAVVFLDLDDFKEINDTRGHDAGDLTLTALTNRLGAVVREDDTLARLGGDEFVVLCEELSSEEEAIVIAERLACAAMQPFTIAGIEHAVSVSAGLVTVPDAAAASAHAILRDADAAMCAAKESGKGHVAVFDERIRERMSQRSELEAALQGALVRGEFLLFYQPVVDLERGCVVGAEALLRWRHPERGLLAPAEFLAVAEGTGLIAEIGEWAIESACRQAVAWRDAWRGGPAAAHHGPGAGEPMPVSINISGYQLTRSDLVGVVSRVLRETGLEPGLLSLEVTESVLLEDAAAARRELARLAELGVKLVIDDFGTGYSSLAELRHLPVNGLKLDRSFVSAAARSGRVGDDSLIAAVAAIARAIGAEMTAEGVETAEQARRVRDHGCGRAQGHLFARAMPPEALTELIAFDREHLRLRQKLRVPGSAGSEAIAAARLAAAQAVRAGV